VTFMYVTWTVATLAVAFYGLATSIWQLMLASLAFNALETAGTIAWATMKQRHVPAALLGRVSSLDWLISIGLLPLSFALTGPVSGAIGARETLIGAGMLGAAITLGALYLPGMRALEGRVAASETDGRYDRVADVVVVRVSTATSVRSQGRPWGGVELDGDGEVVAAWHHRASERLPASYLAALPELRAADAGARRATSRLSPAG
jgi:hypothetical protein